MQEGRGSSSEGAQLEDATTYLNHQIQEGATVRLRHYVSSGLKWPVTKVGNDFVVLLMDNGEESVIPRKHDIEFIVTKPTQNARP